jgi:type I restriction enzyme M protein
MTGKKGMGRSPEKVISREKSKQQDPKALSKNRRVTASKLKPSQASVKKNSPASYLTGQVLPQILQEKVNEKWNACWPVSALRPIAVLDLICYILFIKKLEEKGLIISRNVRLDNIFPTKEEDELSWSVFKNLDGVALRKLFTKEKGITDLIKNYSGTNLQYSQFLKQPLSLSPTANLLTNVIDLIKIMEVEDAPVQAAIFDCLLNKTEIELHNCHAYSQDNIARFIVEMMNPTPADLILDPYAGLGFYLVQCVKHFKKKNSAYNNIFDENYFSRIYSGLESDPTRLRICAMNLIMNGIDSPALNVGNISLLQDETELPSLIISNLILENANNSNAANGNYVQKLVGGSEAGFMNLVMKKLRDDGRAAIVLPEYFLYNNSQEVSEVRKCMVADKLLEAVINLPHTGDELFSGACIIILNKLRNKKNDRVWFYKILHQPSATGIDNEKEPGVEGNMLSIDYDFVVAIIASWKNRGRSIEIERNEESFFVTVNEIMNRDYNLCFNEYRKGNKEDCFHFAEEPPVAKKEMPKRLILQMKIPPVFVKRNIRQTIRPVLHKISVSIVPALLFFLIATPAIEVLVGKKNNNDSPVSTKKMLQPVEKEVRRSFLPVDEKKSMPAILTPQQIKAILYDTSGIKHFDEPRGDQPMPSSDSIRQLANDEEDNSVAKEILAQGQKNDPSPGNFHVKYSVVDTTFFHDEPIAQSRRKTYLDPLNKNVLRSLQDKNGFIYIVYTNALGRTSKGWISKKDLRPLQ